MQTLIHAPYHADLTAPLAVVVALMLLAPYWLGPIRIKFKQSRPASPEGMQLVSDVASLPPPLAAFATASRRGLEALGFANFAVLRGRAGIAVLGDIEPGTVATALAIQKSDGHLHSLVGYTTQLRGGRKLRTSNAPFAAITPAPAGEDRLRLPRERDATRLFAVHERRLREATGAGAQLDRLTVGDPVAYQHREELASLAQFVASGYWRRQGDRLTLTWKGAFLSAWRLLPPWREIGRGRDERRAQALGSARA